MRDDLPAAQPLLALIIGLALSPSLVAPYYAAGALIVVAAGLVMIGRPRPGLISLVLAAGIAANAASREERAAEWNHLQSLQAGRFAVVEAPLERDWSARGYGWVLRPSSFRAGGVDIAQPLTIYVRFEPPAMRMEESIRLEGFLRRDERGRYVMSVKSPRLLTYQGTLHPLRPATWNRWLANRLRPYAAQYPEEIALVEALVLGRGERLSEETREQFRRGGTYHLLVFSGLQISLAAALIALILRWSGAPRGSDLSLLLFALLAPLFIGPSASVSRAGGAIALFALSRILRRPTSIENLWCLSMLLRLLFVPQDLDEPAFHLTYAGAGALLFIGRPLAQTPVRWLAYAAAAELAIAPLTLYHFHQFALGGSLATALMTPVMLAMLLTGALFCATEATALLWIIGGLHRLCSLINEAAAPASGFFTAPSSLSMAVGFGAAILCLGLRGGNMRTALLILALLVPQSAAAARFISQRQVRHPQAIFLDVGQGDAILLRAEGQSVLVDGGGRAGDSRFGESRLIPMLVDRGVRRLDRVALSHAHPDHCGGLEAVLRHLEVGELWITPRRFRGECASRLLDAASRRAIPIRLLRGGEELSVGRMQYKALLTERVLRRAPENNASLVLHVRIGRRSLLLPGDIEREAERMLAGQLPRADILKVPHHGSRTSTSPMLLDAVQPRIAAVSCGRGNLFGHPHPLVLGALAERRARIWRTDLQGTITMEFRQEQIHVIPEIDTP